MARNPQRDLPGGIRRAVLILALAALPAAPAVADPLDKALEATARGDWKAARNLWKGQPHDRAPAYRAQVHAELLAQETAPMLQAAAAAQARADWEEAARILRQALVLDPTIEDAQKARARVDLHLRAHAQAKVLDGAEDPFDPSIQARMRAFLESLRAQRLSDPALDATGRKFARTLAAASVPVPVVLTSDGLSSVRVSGIGLLGVVDRKSLDLRPGNYIATAHRPGYRNARKVLRVRPDRPLVVDIRCTESLQ